MRIRRIQGYGWRKDNPDHRDLLYKVERISEVQPVEQLPKSVDLRPQMPPIVDQGNLGSCTANSIAGALGFIHKDLTASRLFIYYNERQIEGTINYDAGAQLRDGISCVNEYGACQESVWPYDVSKFTVKPNDNCYVQAKQDLVTQYLRVTGLQEMKSCLAAGFPFVFGFTVYESFEGDDVASTGNMPMPGTDEGVMGGHAVCAVGYDDARGVVIVRNSWGNSWGDKGYFYMPYSYISDENLCSDFWTIRK